MRQQGGQAGPPGKKGDQRPGARPTPPAPGHGPLRAGGPRARRRRARGGGGGATGSEAAGSGATGSEAACSGATGSSAPPPGRSPQSNPDPPDADPPSLTADPAPGRPVQSPRSTDTRQPR